MNSAAATNAPREVTIAGATYLVSALTLNEWGLLQAWLLDHATDPLVAALASLRRAKAAGVDVSEDDRKLLLKSATAEARCWPPRPGTPEWFDLMQGVDGAALKFLEVVLRKHQPSLGDDEIRRISRESAPDESADLIGRALGYAPVPKGEASGGTPPPTSTTGGG